MVYKMELSKEEELKLEILKEIIDSIKGGGNTRYYGYGAEDEISFLNQTSLTLHRKIMRLLDKQVKILLK